MPTSSRAGQIHADNPFERALLASCLLYLHPEEAGGEILELLATLCGEQRPDGSWSSAPVLRVTKGDCYQPWSSADGGSLYEDTHRLFTTATVLHAWPGS